jgi:hypothetical protein
MQLTKKGEATAEPYIAGTAVAGEGDSPKMMIPGRT